MSNLEILNKYDFKFNKAYGQNFIFDTNFLKSFVDGIIDKETEVLEIGPGAGTLTGILCEYAKRVVSYEIDRNLEPILKENLSKYDNSEIVFGDIMKFNIEDIEANFKGKYTMVANLPYYITTPIIFKFLENAKNLQSMIIMVQLEVAERLVAKSGSKDYGAITPAIDYRANAKIIKRVSRKMFTPVPNVDSAIVKIDFIENKYQIDSTEILDETIKSAFAMRRKTLENNLKTTFKLSSDTIQEIFSKLGFQPQIRGEKLNTEDFVKLSNEIKKYVSK
ncbi:MAG: ribosomal RNA small subunit methyltransferase A [Clostridiales bacterium]|nr:ribosomal RNA small subunit methyltransferase A [Clostridiales bacterium]